MLLRDKTAIVYGAGGSIGGAMAREFAAQGAECFLGGRTAAKLDAVAAEIRSAGGRAETAVVDVLDASAVNDHADAVVKQAGGLDISVNVITHESLFQPLADVDAGDFAKAIERIVLSQLVTTKAAARHMTEQESGVILFFGGSDYQQRDPGMGTVQVGFDAVEALRRQWACELGPHGVRLVSLLTGGIPETFPDFPGADEQRQAIADATLLKRAATLSDVGHVAAFVASDRARSMTATQVNISAGAHGD